MNTFSFTLIENSEYTTKIIFKKEHKDILEYIFDSYDFLFEYNASNYFIINEKFDMIKTYISKKNVINEMNLILNEYYRWFKIDNNFVRITSRQLLSAWLIINCPTIVLGNLDCDEKKYVKLYAENIIQNFYQIK